MALKRSSQYEIVEEYNFKLQQNCPKKCQIKTSAFERKRSKCIALKFLINDL